MSSARSGALAVGDAVQVGDVAHELAGGERRRHRLVLGHQRHPPVHPPVATRIPTLDGHGTLVDADEPGDRPHQRRLAGAVRPEQPGDAGAEGAAQLGQGDLLPEPHRDVGDLDRGVRRERRVSGIRRPAAAAAATARSPLHPPVAAEQHGRGDEHDRDVRGAA